MSIKDISSKIQTLQVRLDEENKTRDRFPPQQGSGRRPSNLVGTPSARKKNLGLPPFSQPANRIEPETEDKLKQIMKRNGILTINSEAYRSEIKDLDDLGELGNGTSGHVVKMKHKPTDTIIAVKQMRRTGNSEENKRIIMDIDVVLKSHDCPYIVHCLGCFITEADVWICMELMATCFDKLMKKSKQPVPEPILGKVTVATVKALSYLKDNHGVIHRDVKPSNILIDERGNIKLCDFGISGRLVDSKAKTRSAGCAAYMAPERIDPKKPEYDIRADVWSLGITLVELATGSFPYKGCNTDFEVLTHVLEADPPRLPTDKGFTQQFQFFVDKCLTKNYRERPKYAELLETDFLKQYEHANIDVAAWFASVVHMNDPKSTELRRCPPNVSEAKPFTTTAALQLSQAPVPLTSESASIALTTAPSSIAPIQFTNFNHLKTTETAIPSAVPTSMTSVATSMSHIPIYQYNNFSSQSNSTRNHASNDVHDGNASMGIASDNHRTEMNTFRNIQHEPIAKQNEYEPRNQQLVHASTASQTSAAQMQTINQSDRIYGQSVSPPALYQRQPFPVNQNQLHREQLSELLRQQSHDMTTYTTNVSTFDQNRMHSASPRMQSFPEQNAQIGIGSPHRFQQLQYYSNASPNTIDRTDRVDGAPYGDVRLDNLNKFYKSTLPAQSSQPNDEFDESIGKVLLKRDAVYNKLGHETLHRNNSLSPFLQRKLSLQAQQHRVAAYDPSQNNRWHIHSGYGTSMSATASPNLDARKRFQTAIPAFDSDESSVVRLHGNTSPIVLQRFYHQQSQLRERETSRHASPQHQPNDFVKYPTAHATSSDKMESNNHFLRHIPKLTQKLNPFKGTSNSNNHNQHQHSNSSSSAFGSVTANDTSNYHTEAIYTNSNIPILKKSQRSSTLPPSSSPIYANNSCEYPCDMTEQGVHRPLVYGRMVNYKNGYETGPGNIDNRDDHGWFNSLAGVVKRRFASYVKSHLASGDSKKDRIHDRNQLHMNHYLQQTHHHQQQQRASSPYRFDKLRTGQTVAPSSSSMPSSPYCTRATIDNNAPNGMDRFQSTSPRVGTIDRRHRSPDPPPRYNRGQSPLVLRRNLLEYGGQVNQSPVLPRRFVSPSPPLPPPRKGSDSIPGSPQHFRTRINYTPELQRRAYRAIDQ